MSTPLAVTHMQGRTRLPALRNVMIAGLAGNVLVNSVLTALILRTLIPPLAIILALALVVAGVCATRWRWAPHLAVLWCVLSVVPGLEPYISNLSHPGETGTFIATLLGLALLLVTVIAGGVAMIYGDRQVAEGRATLAARLPDRTGDVRARGEPGRRNPAGRRHCGGEPRSAGRAPGAHDQGLPV